MKLAPSILALALATAATGLQAQQGTYGSTNMTPEVALAATQAALQSCRDSGYQVAVAVTDRSGVTIALLRDRYAGAHTVETAMRKAYTAASFNMDTLELARVTQAGEEASGIRMVPGILALGGGLPVAAAGSLIGGIGVSGAPGGDADRACAQAGIDAVEVDLEF
ncbi:MAG: heme-binding protein [Ottowia sp.]|nr:heme-binding protein [Ottowia sp.]